MSCPMPEIGSCISLISKADIRYEGLLFTVDPDRCTIALARVKSYGTEDRETQFPIAPQNQCYDYILFRGSDIKDIRVINNNPVPNDPAIMQMHLPPQQQLPPPLQNKLGQAGFQPQPGGFMMPPIGGPGGPPMGGPPPGHTPMGAPYSSFGGINNLGGMLSSANELVSKSPFPPSGGGGGPQAVNQMQQQQQANQQSQQSSGGNNELGNFLVGTSSSDQQSSSGTAAGTGRIGSSPEVNNIDGAVVAEHRDQDLIGAGAGGNAGGSRSTTPSNLLSRKSPTVDMAVQTNQGQQQQQNRDGNRSGGDGANLEQRGGHQRNRNNSQRSQGQQRERRDSGKNDGGQMKENFNKNNMQQQRQGSQGGGQGGQGGQNQNRGGWNNQNRGQNNNQNNSQNSNNNMRGRPRGPRGPAQGTNNQSSSATAATSSDSKQKQSNNNNNNNTVSNRKSNNSNNNNHNNNNHHPKQGANRTKNLLKFENDYDFEQANNKFEELRSQLSKLKVGEEVKPEQLINNEVSVDTKKDDSGNETGAGDHEPEEDDVQCYDKTKSFFDNISCEAMERAKGKQQRTDWRQERKLNTETFGVGSTRRGGYNRRGGYYNRGPNNYRGNNHQYRGGNNYRGRSHHNNGGGGQNRQQNHHHGQGQGQGQGQQQHQQQQQQNGLPHNGNRNITNINTNQQQQQQSQQREQQALAAASSQQQQQQQPAAIEVGAGK